MSVLREARLRKKLGSSCCRMWCYPKLDGQRDERNDRKRAVTLLNPEPLNFMNLTPPKPT